MRKPSGRPGSSHLAALQKAHGAGDFRAAKTHALNYAKECHAHGGPAEEAAAHGIALAADAKPATKPDRRLQLARIAAGRKRANS